MDKPESQQPINHSCHSILPKHIFPFRLAMTVLSASICYCYDMPSWLVSIEDAISWGASWTWISTVRQTHGTWSNLLCETGVWHGKTSQIVVLQDSLLSRQNKIKATVTTCHFTFVRANLTSAGMQQNVGPKSTTVPYRKLIHAELDYNQNVTSPFPGPPLMRKQFTHFDIHQQTTSTKRGSSHLTCPRMW